MTSKKSVAAILTDQIERRLLIIRGQKVMISTHLAELCDVQPKALIQADTRNSARFPDDFMFPLTTEELGWHPKGTLRLYRTGCRDAFQ